MPPAAEPGPVGKGGQTPKKGGSKAKGSVRAKSGCYTCRIRRKKCDERPDAEGRCETCLRLRLQCLGFGAKRPEWLRENNNVNELRDKIKAFLASQGMIKGHSGSGPRAPEQEPPTLHLSAQTFPSPTQSPPSQLLVLSNEAARHEPISAVREEWPFPGPPPPPGYDGSLGPPPPPGHPAGPPILHPGGPAGPSSRNPSPFGHPPPPPQEGFPPGTGPHEPPYLTTHPNNTTLVPHPQWYMFPQLVQPQQQPQHVHALHHLNQQQQQQQQPSPAQAHRRIISSQSLIRQHVPPTIASSFGPLYYADLSDDSDVAPFYDGFTIPAHPVASGSLDELASHYLHTVAQMQYQLADKVFLSRILFEDVQNDGFARRAARLLASVQVSRSSTPNIPRELELTASPAIHNGYKELLNLFSFAKQHFGEDDALAALNVISTFLFNGGRGDWERWLRVACSYSSRILDDRIRFRDYRDAMLSCSDKERFIIMTTFWFDVLASVTTMDVPIFVDVIHELYNPANQSGIVDVSLTSPGSSPDSSSSNPSDPSLVDPYTDALSMLPIMGAENRIVWAIAQISALSVWRQTREKEGRMSIHELSRRANNIEMYLAPSDPPLHPRSEDDIPRILASEAFRTCAKVYLRTIVHGNHPLVPEIAEAVNEAIVPLENIASAEGIDEKDRHVAVRSSVFPFFICAALTTKVGKRNMLMSTLNNEGEVGNCRGVIGILNRIIGGGGGHAGGGAGTGKVRDVPWRREVHKTGMLLV